MSNSRVRAHGLRAIDTTFFLRRITATVCAGLMSNSAFVLDWSRPVPLHEFFLPLADVSLPPYRACTQMKALEQQALAHGPAAQHDSQRRVVLQCARLHAAPPAKCSIDIALQLR